MLSSTRKNQGFSRRRLLSSALAATVALAGFTSTSCASPRFPLGGGAGYPLRTYAGGYELQVLIDGAPARTFERGGETYVLGAMGARYTLRVVNHSGRRVEAVVSVDGRDVIDGKPAELRRRGYIVDPHDTLVIDGFRTSDSDVAAFRFGRVADSYAARTSGDRNVGVVGLATFSERGAVWTPAELERRDTADPFPSRGYAMPPR